MHIRDDSNDALPSSQHLDPFRQGQDQGQGENFVLDFPRHDSFQKKGLDFSRPKIIRPTHVSSRTISKTK